MEQPELDSNVRWLDLAQPVDEDLIDRLAEGFAQQPMQTRKTQAGPNAEVRKPSPCTCRNPWRAALSRCTSKAPADAEIPGRRPVLWLM